MALIDILSGLLVLFTQTPIPDGITEIHAGFLLFKGVATMLPGNFLPTPVFYLGGFADLISAAILFTGQPPLLVQYNKYIAGFLLLKGVWSSFGLLKLT
ncbi:hypothetical protein [Candidatus Nanohalobium constans]|uniref:Uncharacterized protein n=1 Tax=Candidatus Nanohalobium constans TaxID=2565781 RepID=A0A5Q0UF93_9ARCH|nr:hypothetical protein [Candidatus Nanohalobium constans]QGA80273.1 hypothetical protein LC1Nh_0372 [Candidatus Nanohalobium constans]